MNSIINDQFLNDLIRKYSESKEQIISNQLKYLGIRKMSQDDSTYIDEYYNTYLKCNDCGLVTKMAYVCGYCFPRCSLELKSGSGVYMHGNCRGCRIIYCEDCGHKNKMNTCETCSNIIDIDGDSYNIYFCEDCFDLGGSHPDKECQYNSKDQKSKRTKIE